MDEVTEFREKGKETEKEKLNLGGKSAEGRESEKEIGLSLEERNRDILRIEEERVPTRKRK